MRRGLVVLSKLADNVFLGVPQSDHQPDDPEAPEPLGVGDVLTWLLKIDFDEPVDFDESADFDEPDEPASPKAEEIVSLRVMQIRAATPRILGRNSALPVSIAGQNLSLPFRLGRLGGRAEGLMVAVTLSGVDVHRVTPNCVLLTDST
jgi:hypothetical protein